MDENNFNMPLPQEEIPQTDQGMFMGPEMGGLEQKPPIQSGRPYFMGEHALVRFSFNEGETPEIIWLVDKGNNTVRSFESEEALKKAFGNGYEQAKKQIITIASPSIDENNDIADGVLEGFTILGPEYAIKEDGTSKKLKVSPSQLRSRYGQDINENGEALGAEALEGLLTALKSKEKETGIPSSYIDKIKKDSNLMAFYLSALAYGKYTLNDVYSDISQNFKEENQ